MFEMSDLVLYREKIGTKHFVCLDLRVAASWSSWFVVTMEPRRLFYVVLTALQNIQIRIVVL